MPMGHMRCAKAWCSARHSSELIEELAAAAVIPGGGIGAGLWQRRLLAEEEALRAPEEETFPGGFLRSVAVPDEGIGVELRRRRFPAEESALRAPEAATFPGGFQRPAARWHLHGEDLVLTLRHPCLRRARSARWSRRRSRIVWLAGEERKEREWKRGKEEEKIGRGRGAIWSRCVKMWVPSHLVSTKILN
uniref:Uncharacterized protein n=1 Tax=Oryza barthii TaxID=65489 RepID=A0A0D3GQA6_9ORYZ